MIIMIFEGYELGYLDLKALKVTTSTFGVIISAKLAARSLCLLELILG